MDYELNLKLEGREFTIRADDSHLLGFYQKEGMHISAGGDSLSCLGNMITAMFSVPDMGIENFDKFVGDIRVALTRRIEKNDTMGFHMSKIDPRYLFNKAYIVFGDTSSYIAILIDELEQSELDLKRIKNKEELDDTLKELEINKAEQAFNNDLEKISKESLKEKIDKSKSGRCLLFNIQNSAILNIKRILLSLKTPKMQTADVDELEKDIIEAGGEKIKLGDYFL